MHPQNALSEALYNMKRDNPIWETSVQVMLDYANTAGRFSVGPDILEGLGWLAAQAGYFATPALICRQWGVYVWCVCVCVCVCVCMRVCVCVCVCVQSETKQIRQEDSDEIL